MVRVSPLANPSVSADLPKAFLHSTSILLPPELPSSNDDEDEDEDEEEDKNQDEEECEEEEDDEDGEDDEDR